MRKAEISIAVILIGIAMLAFSKGSNANETINYTYDPQGRLILVNHSGSINNNVVANYTFDRADNRKNLKVTGAP